MSKCKLQQRDDAVYTVGTRDPLPGPSPTCGRWFISVGYVDVVDESLDEDHDVIVTLGKVCPTTTTPCAACAAALPSHDATLCRQGQFMGEFALLAAEQDCS